MVSIEIVFSILAGLTGMITLDCIFLGLQVRMSWGYKLVLIAFFGMLTYMILAGM